MSPRPYPCCEVVLDPDVQHTVRVVLLNKRPLTEMPEDHLAGRKLLMLELVFHDGLSGPNIIIRLHQVQAVVRSTREVHNTARPRRSASLSRSKLSLSR